MPEPETILDTPQAGPAAIRGGLMRVGGYAVGVLLTVVSAALLFRHLGVVDGGRFVTVLALTSMVSGVTEIGLTTIGLRELATRDEWARQRLMRNLLGLRIALSTVGVGLAVAFAAVAGYDTAMVVGTLVVGGSVVALAVQSTLGISLMVRLKLGWVTLLDLTRQAVLVVLIIGLVAAGAGFFPFLAAQLPAAVVALGLTAWLVRGQVPLRPSFDWAEWRELLVEVLPFAAATVVAAIYFRAALIVLGLVSTAEQTGYFGASFRITEVLLLVPNLMVGTAFPIFSRAARDDHERLAYGVDRVFQAAVVVGGALLVGLVVGAPFAIAVVAGPDFAPSADVLRIQAGALAASFVATTLSYALLSLHRQRALLVAACSALAVNVALAWILGSAHGAQGAALATLIAECTSVSICALALMRAHRHVLPSAAVLPRVVVAAGLGIAVLLIPGLPSVVAATLGLLVYSGAAFALGAIPSEVLDAIRRR